MTLERLKRMMKDAGVQRLYLKRMARADSSQGQIYFGPGFEALNIIPSGQIIETPSDANQILKAPVTLSWMGEDGSHAPAPFAQMILYPQYPEIRMSAFLRNSKNAPSSVLAKRKLGRMLLLGVTAKKTVVGWAGDADHPITKELSLLSGLRKAGVFEEVPIHEADSKVQLLNELARIHSAGWIQSKRLLANGSLTGCLAQNCGGCTLEAELGISSNSSSNPDFLGWEVKQHGVRHFSKPDSGSPITLMTPEPTGGFYKDHGAEAFIRKFGYPDTKGRHDRLNVGGIFRVNKRASLTGLTLILDGFDPSSGKISDITKGLTLQNDAGEPAAIWHYSGLIDHWQRKHEQAVYVPSIHRAIPEKSYHFGPTVFLCEGADFLLFLGLMAVGAICYDPGIKLEGISSANPKKKKRSQFRIKFRDLNRLYKHSAFADL